MAGLVASNTGDEGYTITETDANGNELKGYTTKEDSLNFLHNFGYGGFENTYQTTSFTASKTWVNGVNAAQPDSATVQLEQSTDGGTTYTDYGAAVTLDEDGEWTYTWSDLPAYTKSGAQILYKAAETAISGYTTTDSGVSGTVAAGFQQAFTNTYAYTNIKVSKVWDHGTQGESEQPQSVNIALKDSNGVVTSCVLDADNDWTYTFTNIPIPTDGTSTDDVYTVSEESVDGYDADYNPLEGSDADGWTTTVDNTYNLTKLTVAKTWNHGVQAEAEWPTSAIVTLYANGTVKDTATLSSGNSWTHTFDSLPINDSNGKAIAYTVSEDAVPSYITAIGDKTGGRHRCRGR